MSKPSLFVATTSLLGVLGLFSAESVQARDTRSSATEVSAAAIESVTEAEVHGVTAAPLNCVAQCVREWRWCIASGEPPAACAAERELCKDACYGDHHAQVGADSADGSGESDCI